MSVPQQEHEVTFHGGDSAVNYHAHPTTTTAGTSSISVPMQTTTETSSRRPSFDDVTVAKTGYLATPRSPTDSAMIMTNYVLGGLGFLTCLTWMIVLLIAEGQNSTLALLGSYGNSLMPFLEMAPYFFACLSMVFYAAKRNTTLSWFLVAASNFAVDMFWLILIVPYFINVAFPGDISASCPDSGTGVATTTTQDDTDMCRLRKGSAALSCALAFVHLLWFCIGLIQTIRHWNWANNQTGMLMSKQTWMLLLIIEFCGMIIWCAGNLHLVKLGRDRLNNSSDPVLPNATYFLTLIAVIALIMTAYCVLDATKISLGIAAMFHICAAMMFWAVFVWDARGSKSPSIWFGNNSLGTNSSQFPTDDPTNKAISAGIGIITSCETLLAGLFMAAYAMKNDPSNPEAGKYTGRV